MRRKVLIIIFALFVVSALYFLKCQNNIDLVKDVSLRHTPPFTLLQNRNPHNIVHAQETSAGLLSDSFAFEPGHGNWDKLWMREEGAVTLGRDSEGHDDSPSLVITSRGAKDWSLGHKNMVEVSPGEVYGFSGWVKTSDKEAAATLSVVLYDADKKVLQWHYAKESVAGADNWRRVERSFIIPGGVKYIRFRLTGGKEGKAWFDEIKFKKEKGAVFFEQNTWALDNPRLTVTFDAGNGRWTVLDKRSSKTWRTPPGAAGFLVTKVTKDALRLRIEMVSPQTTDRFSAAAALDPETPEIVFTVEKEPGAEFSGLEFPPVFEIARSDLIVLPLAEGFLFDQKTALEGVPSSLRYKGGWPLAFAGVLAGDAGWMEIVETPIDFELVKDTGGGELGFKNRWLARKGTFGYSRRMRYVFFDQDGYVAMAKRYRQYAREKGFLKTLREKDGLRKNNLSKLIGAVNVWFWGKGKGDFAKELYKAGIKEVLFSSASWDVPSINELGYLTSIYDIYQDVWPPVYHDVTKRHDGWPEDLVLDSKGDWARGWTIKRGLKEYPGGVICSIRGLERAKKHIPEDLKKNPYTARFIDTTTSTPWRECYDPVHPTTRGEDFKNKMALLEFCSNESGLVTGSEDGVDAAVPFADYFEGMMSPGLGRLPDSGRNVGAVKYVPPTEEFLKFQVGEKYRIPLWELVFHDAAVATWYWGDSSNRIPEVWWRRDLFNILYGNMPLWAIRDWDHWKQYKKRFIESYYNVGPVFEKVGWEEMLIHRFVTGDHTVQETVFGNGVKVMVNFGETAHAAADTGAIVPPHGFAVFEKGKVWKSGIAN